MATLSLKPTQFSEQRKTPIQCWYKNTNTNTTSKLACFLSPISKICSFSSSTTTISSNPYLSVSVFSRPRRQWPSFRWYSVSEEKRGGGGGGGAIIETESDEVEDEDEDVIDDDPTSELSYLNPATEAESITEWELDFCSRPILDVRGKKIWELVVCDNSLSLQYTKYFPSNLINSITLKNAIIAICDQLSIPLPQTIRFFRSQLQTIITKACKELGIKPVPSKRCLSLILWLEERYETVYTRHPNFQKGAKPLLVLDNPFPMELPENLFGERWAFVQLPYSEVQKEMSSLEKTLAFGAGLDMDLLGVDIDEKTLVPGLAVASSRAKPLAAWMNGLEVCSIEADTSRACLILSVGISTRYTYATYKKTSVTTKEAEAWETAKKLCGGLHFLAIQEDLDSDDCVGFWLLLDLPPPPV